MKSYAPNDIKLRMVRRLKEYANWNKIIEDSAIDALLTVKSEGLSEISRYLEHNRRENTWSYAQDINSILGQIGLFGYKLKRKISSIGYIYFSHDININTMKFDSELENLSEYDGASISIPIQSSLVINGIPFLTSKEYIYTSGMKYLKVPIIQGMNRILSTTPQKAVGLPFEVLRLNSPNIEAAQDTISESFFNVQLTLPSGIIVSAEEVESIFLADENTYAYEIKNYLPSNLSDGYVDITFGNNVSGIQLPKDTIVTVSYLETVGELGNIVEKAIAQGTATFSNGILYYNNFESILGGKNEDTIETIKINGPRSCNGDGSIITETQYKQAIESIPYVQKAVVYSGLNDLDKEAVLFSAINTLGLAPNKLDIEQDLLLRTLSKKSPLDIVSFIDPSFLNIEINYQAKIDTSKNQDIQLVISNIKSLIYNNYSIFDMDFKESIVKDKITSLIFNNTETGLITSSNCFIEAKEILKPSTFKESIDTFFFEKEFTFNSSFEKIRHDVSIYLLRFDIKWSCINCEFKNKTIFILKNPEYDPDDPFSSYYLVKQYPLIEDVITEEYMTSVINNPLVEPNEIIEGDPLYYPFEVEFNQTSELANTIFKIPRKYNGESYIDFENFTGDELDEEVSISCYAFPLNYNSKAITPLTSNTIINLLESDIKVEVL